MLSTAATALLGVSLAACAGPTGAQQAAPSPATAAEFAVLATDQAPGGSRGEEFPQASTGNYSVVLLSSEGRAVASAQARDPTGVPVQLDTCAVNAGGPAGPCTVFLQPGGPWFSASNSRVYFLDGDSDVRFLTPNGESGISAHLPSGLRTRSLFSVSPDDRRIAVAEFTYSDAGKDFAPDLTTLRIWVEDMGTGAGHHELFNQQNVAAWPVGWHGGNLVLGIGGSVALAMNPAGDPYGAGAFQVIDSNNGHTLAKLGDGCQGLLVPAGIGCATGVQGWNGSKHQLKTIVEGRYCLAASPDGSRCAGSQPGSPPFPMLLMSDAGVTRSVEGLPVGWFDNRHLVFQTATGPPKSFPTAFSLWILDTTTGATAKTDLSSTAQQYYMFGLIPGGLG